jgi:hypothetical protein
MMRSAILSMFLATIALSGGSDSSSAQSASAYAWCGVYPDDIGGQNCYFASREQCLTTMSGIGGYCTRSLYYRPPQAVPETGYVRHHRHSAMNQHSATSSHGRHS